jgi:transposase
MRALASRVREPGSCRCWYRTDLERDLTPLLEMSEAVRAHLALMDRDLWRFARDHPVCRHLMQIFGVGPICSISFYSAIEEPHRFTRSSDVGAYLGLIPRRRESGEMSRTLGITKSGNKLARMHLVNSATVLMNRGPECELKDWALALRQRRGRQRARIALARKLAVVMVAMWKTGSPFRLYMGEPRVTGSEALNLPVGAAG